PTSAPVSIAASAYSSGSSDLFVHAATATSTEHSAIAPTVRRGRFVVMEEQPSGHRGRPPPVDVSHRHARDAAPGSADSFLRRGQLLAEGSSRSTDVSRRGDEAEALLLAQLGFRTVAAVDAGAESGIVGGGANPHERLGAGVVRRPRHATAGG